MEFNALQSTRSVFGPSLLRHSSRAGFTLFYRFTSTNSAASRICYAEYLLHCACTLFLVWQSGLLWCRYASLQFLPHVRALRNNSAEFSTVQKGSLTQKQLHGIWLILIRSVSMLAQISALKLEPVGVARRRSTKQNCTGAVPWRTCIHRIYWVRSNLSSETMHQCSGSISLTPSHLSLEQLLHYK